MCTIHKGQLTCLLFFLSLFCQIGRTGFSHGELAQLARASALQAEGQGFEPPILHLSLKASLVRDSSSVG